MSAHVEGHAPSGDLHARVAATLGASIDPRVWAILEREGHTEVRDTKEFKHLVAQARYYRRLLSEANRPLAPGSRRRRRRAPDDEWRMKAMVLADDVALRAGVVPEVVSFRRRVLKDKRLSEPQARRFVQSRVGSDAEVQRQGRVVVAFPGTDGSVNRVAAGRHSQLGHLWRVADQLCADYGWADYESVWFILTGQTPLPWPIEVDDVTFDGHRVAIRIIVAPWMPARAVLDAFRRVQREQATVTSQVLSDRRRALLTFVRGAPAGSYRQQVARWNRAFPKWSYAEPRGFRRDLQAAQRHMTASTFRLDIARE